MSMVLWDMLARDFAKFGELEKASPILRMKLRRLSEELDLVLIHSDSGAKSEILSKLSAEVLEHIGELDAATHDLDSRGEIMNANPFSEAIPTEILDWATQQLDEEEAAAGIREIRETGGLELNDFLHELEQEVAAT